MYNYKVFETRTRRNFYYEHIFEDKSNNEGYVANLWTTFKTLSAKINCENDENMLRWLQLKRQF